MHGCLSKATATILLLVMGVCLPGIAVAASSWSPTLLVNTESFQTLDEGDGTTNIELRFGQTLNQKIYYERANGRFRFTNSIYVGGGITATGALIIKGNMSGGSLRIDNDANVRGGITASGALQIGGAATITGNTKVRGNLSGASLRIDGNSSFWGSMTASGSITTKQNLTINGDADTNDAVLTFGNNSGNANITFSNASQLFTTNKGIKATGNIRAVGALSGTSLNVDGGSVKINNVQYNFTGSQGGGNTFLKNDGAGNLTWSTTSVGNGSGAVVSLHPEYPNTSYFSSGSSIVGTLTNSYDTTSKENYYRWASSRSSLQDYWVATRVKVPHTFTNFTASGVTLRIRTSSTSVANNYVSIRMLDTAGSNVAVSGGAATASFSANAWRTVTLTNLGGGTYTVDGYITILIKLAALTADTTDIGTLNIQWSTTTP